jgi:hypothetical protein
MLTFEFPDVGKADYFVARLQRERHEYTKSTSGRVVDVHLPKTDDPSVAAITHDYLVLLAKHFGAYDLPKGEERIYLLTTPEAFGSLSSPPEVTLTTLDEFCRSHPDVAAGVRASFDDPNVSGAEGGVAGGFWRLERTAYVGRKA